MTLQDGSESGAGAVLVTGASRGIGRAVADALLQRGGRIIAVARDAERLAELEASAPGAVFKIVADLARPGEAERVVEEAARCVEPSGLAGVVACAGLVRYAGLGSITREDVQAQLDLNLVAPLMMAQAAAPHLRARGGGAIVHVASTLAVRSAPGTAAYAASKAALLSVTRSLALELAPGGVRVNAVLPGVVDTDMVRVPRAEVAPGQEQVAIEEQLEALRQLHPLGRLGAPGDVAEAVCYLLEARWVTGAALEVDGGLLAG